MRKLIILFVLLSAGICFSQPTMIRIYGTVYDYGSNPPTPINKYKITVSEVQINNQLWPFFKRKTFKTNINGYVAFYLPLGSQAKIKADIFGFTGDTLIQIPASGDSIDIATLQAASTSVSTNAGFVTIRESDGSPSYLVTGNNDTLVISGATLSQSGNAITLSITAPPATSANKADSLRTTQFGTIDADSVMFMSRSLTALIDSLNTKSGLDTLAFIRSNMITFIQNNQTAGGGGSGDITAVNAGRGILGGGLTGSVTMSMDTTANMTITGNWDLGTPSALIGTNITGTAAGLTAGAATALSANGSNAASGNAILGIDASGNAEGEFDVWTEAENTAAGYIPKTIVRDTVVAVFADSSVSKLGQTIDDAEVVNTITLDNITQITTRPVTSLTGGNWKVFYTNGSGVPTELPIGANGLVLKSNGTTAAPSWQSDATGGGGSATADSAKTDFGIDDFDKIFSGDFGDVQLDTIRTKGTSKTVFVDTLEMQKNISSKGDLGLRIDSDNNSGNSIFTVFHGNSTEELFHIVETGAIVWYSGTALSSYQINYSVNGITPTWTVSGGSMDLTSGTLKQGGVAVVTGTTIDSSRASSVTDSVRANGFAAAADLLNTGDIKTGVVGDNELASTAVTPASYTLGNFTVDADGRITSASNGTEVGDIESVTANAPLTGGGTTGAISISADTTDATNAALATQYDLRNFITGNQNITLSGDVTGSGTTAITTTLSADAIKNRTLATIASDDSILFKDKTDGLLKKDDVFGLKTALSLSNVENTALSTWPGSANITTLGTISTGVWNGTAIPVAFGGTNQTSYTNGQLLIGNSTGNTLSKSTLTAGTNITITNGAGSVTISSTAAAADSDFKSINVSTSKGIQAIHKKFGTLSANSNDGKFWMWTSGVDSSEIASVSQVKRDTSSYTVPFGSSAVDDTVRSNEDFHTLHTWHYTYNLLGMEGTTNNGSIPVTLKKRPWNTQTGGTVMGTITITTAGVRTTTFTNASVGADSVIVFTTGTISGTPTVTDFSLLFEKVMR